MKRTPNPARRAVTMALSAALAVATLGMAPAVQAQDASNYPNRPIRIVSPYEPGGLGDTFIRYLGQRMSTELGQPVVVESKPGGSQTIGADTVARAPADGYTLLLASQSAMVFNSILRTKLPYDAQKDFTPISLLFQTPVYLVARKNLPAKNVAELIAYAKANPGKVSYASLGVGSSHQLLAEMFRKQAGIELLHVPYKGSASAATDLIAGRVDIMFEGGASSLPHVKAGEMIALGVSGEKRAEIMPDLPAIKETLPTFAASVWFGLSGPAKLPAPIVTKLNTAVTKILSDKATHDKFVDLGVETLPGSPQVMVKRIATEIPQWDKVAKDAGIQPE
jgi:tripartite-type tricarboxylate transporter receptor subunit TctC